MTASAMVEYQVQRSVDERTLACTRLITGCKVFHFEVPMIGVYVNAGKGRTERPRRVEISPAVPGAQHRISTWALGDCSKSVIPALEHVTTGDVGELKMCDRWRLSRVEHVGPH